MAAGDDAADALYSAIALQAKGVRDRGGQRIESRGDRQLAKAFAWLNSLNQPH